MRSHLQCPSSTQLEEGKYQWWHLLVETCQTQFYTINFFCYSSNAHVFLVQWQKYPRPSRWRGRWWCQNWSSTILPSLPPASKYIFTCLHFLLYVCLGLEGKVHYFCLFSQTVFSPPFPWPPRSAGGRWAPSRSRRQPWLADLYFNFWKRKRIFYSLFSKELNSWICLHWFQDLLAACWLLSF